eukprot:3599311-Alexandrium_andersonii.AAC.1
MSASLVGSEMCIRDSALPPLQEAVVIDGEGDCEEIFYVDTVGKVKDDGICEHEAGGDPPEQDGELIPTFGKPNSDVDSWS